MTMKAPAGKPEDKPARILQAALTLFAERGYAGTAMPDLARHAGVGAGTIYRHFSSKEVLVNAVFQHAKNLLREQLLRELHLELPTRALFTQLWQQLARFAREHPLEFRFLELHHHQPYLDEDSRAIERQVLVPIWAYCVASRQAGVARDMPAEALMALIWGAFVGLFKAEYSGYLQISEHLLMQAEEACWASFSPSSTGVGP